LPVPSGTTISFPDLITYLFTEGLFGDLEVDGESLGLRRRVGVLWPLLLLMDFLSFLDFMGELGEVSEVSLSTESKWMPSRLTRMFLSM
jgi:hypothetical protein